MCGIVGYFYFHDYLDYCTNEITKMINVQLHRGPDDLGIVGIRTDVDDIYDLMPDETYQMGYNGMIGFDRLSIQDLSMNGHQPMYNVDNKVIVSFNGEIYNANKYKQELIHDGVKFKSTTDTEVLMYLYIKYGIEKTAKLLNGMFAISICDLKKRKLFLLRDRVGIKPLYYVFTEKRFSYASELKCFLELSEFKPDIRMDRINENFTFYKPLNNILFSKVEQVKPGEIVMLDIQTYILKKSVFFNIDNYVRPKDSSYGINIWMDKMKEKLYECSENQKISDKNVGCQLSGGVDSSIVTYFASKAGINPLQNSISIIFNGNERKFSEEKYIDVVKDKLGISIHKKIIDIDYVLENYEKAIWHSDTVIGRPNSIGLMLLTKEAKKYVTVLLSGEGSDELLGGYLMFTQGKEIDALLQKDREVIVSYVNNQPEVVHSYAEYAVIAQQKTNSKLCKDLLPNYSGKDIIEKRIDLFNEFHGTNFDKQIKYSISTYLPELLLCQDKMSMANSIENRVPILDNDFIDFAFTIPEKYLLCKKNNKWQGKYLLKEVCSEIYGEDFAYRRKMGFGLPYYIYFKDNRFKDYFYDIIISGARKRNIINADVLIDWYKNLGTNSWGESELFWKACSLEVWCQLFIDRRSIIAI